MKRADYTTAAEMLSFQAQVRPHETALIFEARETSYLTLDEQSGRVAAKLIEMGVVAGDHIGVLSKNNVRFFEVLFGAMKAGAIATPINWRFVAAEVDYVVSDAEIKVLFYEER